MYGGIHYSRGYVIHCDTGRTSLRGLVTELLTAVVFNNLLIKYLLLSCKSF